jgi:hypothetical protein
VRCSADVDPIRISATRCRKRPPPYEAIHTPPSASGSRSRTLPRGTPDLHRSAERAVAQALDHALAADPKVAIRREHQRNDAASIQCSLLS